MGFGERSKERSREGLRTVIPGRRGRKFQDDFEGNVDKEGRSDAEPAVRGKWFESKSTTRETFTPNT